MRKSEWNKKLKCVLVINIDIRQHSDGMKKLDAAVKDVEYYRQEAENLRTHYNDVVLEKQRVDQEVISLRRFLEEDRQEMSDLRRQHQELLNSEVSKCTTKY